MLNKVERYISFKYARKVFSFLLLLLTTGVFLSGFLFVSLQSIEAAVGIRETINFQGKLVNDQGLNVADSTYTIVFTLYDAASGGSNFWTETRSVATVNGIFREELGTTTSLSGVDFNDDGIYLGIKVGADLEMTPRVRFTATPYAFQAKKVPWSGLQNALANLALSMGSYTSTFTYGASTGSANLFNLTDTVSNTGTGRLLSVTTATSSTLTPFHVSASGVEALIVDSSGNVGIGTTDPSYKLDVNGDVRIASGSELYSFGSATLGNRSYTTPTYVTNGETFTASIQALDDAVEGIVVGSGGVWTRDVGNGYLFPATITDKVGIGMTAPVYALDIAGSLNLSTGNTFKINGTDVLSSTTLGSTVVNSSLTSVGTITSGSWQGATILRNYGGTGFSSYTEGDLLIGNSTSGLNKLGIGTNGQILTSNGTAPSWNSLSSLNIVSGTGSNGYLSLWNGTNTQTTASVYESSNNVGIGGTAPTVRPSLYVGANGNIGIGTTGPGYKLDVNGDVRIASGSELYSFGSATLGNRSYTTPTYVANGETFTASIQALDDAVELVVSGSEGVWTRGAGNGYLFPATITDKVGIGVTAPVYALDINGSLNLSTGNTFKINGTDVLSSTTLGSAIVNSSLTSVGTITSGSWQGATILRNYGGTGFSSYTEGDLLTGNASSGLSKLGIGTNGQILTSNGTAPSWNSLAALNIISGTGSNGYLSLWNGTNTQTTASVYESGNNVGIGGTAPTVRPSMYVGANGNIGIGTTGPGYKLDVNGDIRIVSGSELYSFGSATLGNRSYTTPTYVANGETFTASIQALDDAVESVVSGSGGVWTRSGGTLFPSTLTDSVGIGRTAPVALLDVAGTAWLRGGTANNTGLFVNSTGSVGIGTTSPGEKLVVSDATKAAISFNRGSASGQIEQNDSGGALRLQNTTGETLLQLRTYGASYLNGGNVGIGTTDPGAKLEVAGTSKFGGVINTNGNWISGDGGSEGLFVSSAGYLGINDPTPTNALDVMGAVRIGSGYNNFTAPANGAIIEGSVGIGTTNPGYKLDIAGTSSEVSLRLKNDLNQGSMLYFSDNTNNFDVGIGRISGTRDFGIYGYQGTAGWRMAVTSVGNVGIGTTNPGATLDIEGSLMLGIGVSVNNIKTTVGVTGDDSSLVTEQGIREALDALSTGSGLWTDGGAITYLTSATDDVAIGGTTSAAPFFFDESAGLLTLNTDGSGGGLVLGTDTQLYRNAANVLRTPDSFVVDGNVGIGTTNPQAKLHVYGDGNSAIFGTGTLTDSYIAIRDTANGAYFGIDASQNAGAGAVLIQGGSNKAIAFDANTSVFGAGAPDMYINPSGNIGIGTTDQGVKLEVAGTTRLRRGDGLNYIEISGDAGGNYITSDDAGVNQKHLFISASPTGADATDRSIIFRTGKVAGVLQSRLTISGDGTATFSNQIRAGNGTVGAPAYSFTNSTNSGIYMPSTANIGIGTSGVERIRIAANGFVGIGTTNPQAKLEVSDVNAEFRVSSNTANTGSSLIRLNGQSATSRSWTIKQNGFSNPDPYDLIFDFDTATTAGYGDVMFRYGGTSNMTIKTSGLVGIGTTNPLEKLVVSGGGVLFSKDGLTTTSNNPFMVKTATGGTVALGWFENTDTTAANAYGVGIRTAGTSTQYAFKVESNGGSTTGLYVANNGSVGIGTASPGSYINTGSYFKPDSSGKIFDLYSASNESSINLVSNQNADDAHIGGLYFSRSAGQSDAHRQIAAIQGRQNSTGTLAGGELWFFTKSTGSGNGVDSPRMMIDSSGNVGIGTTNPGAALEVAGQVKITGGTPGANKVLTSDANGLASWASLGAASITADSLDFTEFKDAMALDALTKVNLSGYDFGFYGTGNVGIGTTSPGSALHILTAGTANTQTIVLTLGSNTSTRPILQFSEGIGSGLTSGMSIEYDGRGSGTANMLNINDINGSPTATFRSGGYLGIGTTNPSQSFDTTGDIRVGGQDIYGGGTGTSGIWRYSTTYPDYGIFYTDAATDRIDFSPNGGGTTTPTMSIYGGNVGIGMTAPGYKLTVAGGAINIDQDQPIRAGGNWLMGQDSGTNLIHIGSSAVANDIRFDTNSGAGRMIIKANGNVGIGTTNPQTKFVVSNNGTQGLEFHPTGASGESAAYVQSYNRGTAAYTPLAFIGANHMFWTPTSGYQTFYITGTSNVGIGTSAPTHKLELATHTTAAGGMAFGTDVELYRSAANTLALASGDSLNIVSGALQFAGTEVITSGRLFRAANGTVAAPAFSFASDTNTGMYSGGTDILRFATAGTDKFTILANGSIGIGTTAPTSQLHVVASSGQTNLLNIADSSNSSVLSATSSKITSAVPHEFLAAGDVSMANDLIFTNQSSATIKSNGPLKIAAGEVFESLNLTLKTYNSGKLILESSNLWADGTNVGIGTTAPTATLQVVGNILGTTISDGTISITSGTITGASSISSTSFVGALTGNASTATTLQNARTINGTSFNGSANITTANWGTSRTLTIGSTGKSVNGSANVSWSLAEIGAAAASHSHVVGNVSDAYRWWNNFGEVHATRTSFDATNPSYNFGWRYVQGSTNGPGVNSATQYYSLYTGLGNDYAATGAGSYGMQLAIPRNVTNPYLTIRYNENNVLGAWQKISAGYADTAGNASTATTLQTARTINGVSFNGSANITVEPYIEDDESTNATRYLTFTDTSTAGYKRLNEDSALSYNPSTNILSSTGLSIGTTGISNTGTYLQQGLNTVFRVNNTGTDYVGMAYYEGSNTLYLGASSSQNGNIIMKNGAGLVTTQIDSGGSSYFGGGSVRIGSTAAPGTTLDVTGTGRFSSTLTASNGFTMSAGTLTLPANSVTDAMVSNTLTASTFAADPTNCSAGQFPLGIAANGSVQSCTTAYTAAGTHTGLVRSTAAGNSWITGGNVGIGTSSPASALDVMGLISIGNGDYGTPRGIRFRNTTDTGTNVLGGGMYQANSNILYIQSGTANNITFRNSSGVTMMELNSTALIASNGFTLSAGTLTLPANSVTDAMVSDTLTASNLVAGSSVVSDAEVDNNITINGGTISGTNSISGTLSTTAALTIGDGGDAINISSNDWAISTTGVMTGISGITSNGSYVQTGGTTTFRIGSAVDQGLYYNNNSNQLFVGGDNGQAGSIIVKLSPTTTNILLNSNGNSYINNGNFGIGTTNPGGKLDVRGGQLVLDNGDLGAGRGIRFRNTTDGVSPSGASIFQSNGNQLYIQAGAGNSIILRNGSGADQYEFGTASLLGMNAGGAIKPRDANSTTALQIRDYGGNHYVNFDSTNQRVGIGTNTPQKRLHVQIGTDDAPVRFQDLNGYCEINPTTTTWTCTSDMSLKKDVISLDTPDNLSRLNQLRPVSFKWKTQQDETLRYGLIAQEVQSIFPEFVGVDSEGLKSVSYGSFTPILISAVQEQQMMITSNTDNLTNLSQSVDIRLNQTGELIDVVNQQAQASIVTQNATIDQINLEKNVMQQSIDTLSDIYDALSTRVDTLEQEIIEANTQISSLDARVTALEQFFATDSAIFYQNPNASASATIARSITDTEVIFDKDIISEGDMTVLGKLAAGDISAIGTISNGLLVINGFNDSMATPSATITTFGGPLQLQHDGANSLEIMASKVSIDTEGNVLVRDGAVAIENQNLIIQKGSIKGSDSIRGIDIAVPEGATEFQTVFTEPKDTSNYAVSVMPTWFTSTIIESKTAQGFVIKFSAPVPANARLDWIIIE